MTESVSGQVGLINNGVQHVNAAGIVAQRSQIVEASMDIAFGSIAGMISKIFEYPFDTVKVRLQSQSGQDHLRYNGPVDCFRKSLKADGLSSLYRGISAPMFGAALETSSLFLSYRITQNTVRSHIFESSTNEPLPLPALIFCGATSGAFTSLVLTPVELIKCQMQVPTEKSGLIRPRIPSLIASVYKHQGIIGFWRGQLGTLIRETGGSAAWFGSYEGVTAMFRHYNQSDTQGPPPLLLWQQLIAGASAGMCYNFMFYPADTIKSRMQTEDLPMEALGHRPRPTFLSVGKEIWRQHGLHGFYRGCGITVARAAPSSAMIFTIYEGLRGFF